MRKLLLATLALGLLVGCSAATQPTSGGGAIGAPAIGRDGGQTAELAKGAPAPDQPATQPGSIPVPAALDPTRALILTASISMRANDPWGAADRAQAVATSMGGDVMSMSQSGKGDDRHASLVLRVPAERFNDALRQLRALSDVEVLTSSVDSKDVTEQFVDLEARLRAKQAEEQRYLALLARAERIEDILRIDQSLAQVRTQIEQLTGQVNSIKTRTTFSTISLSITPAGVLPPSDPKVYDPTRTVERAIAALGVMLRVIADLAIWTLVFGWIPLLVLGAALGMQRMRRATTTASTPTAP
ncbi:MAG TPA: DUF4349 domain-containing protein [Candidatus Limnocylindria bacterium]|nr:DUF4349 domain-containing protein [Candidatus Limnocylindria bacterium]